MKSTKSQRNNHLPKTTKSHYVICKSLNNVPEDLYGATFQKSPYKVNFYFYKVHFFARCILLHNLRQHLETLSQVCGAPQCGSVPTVWQCAHIKSSQNIFKSNLASAKPPSGLQKVLWSQFNTPDCKDTILVGGV